MSMERYYKEHRVLYEGTNLEPRRISWIIWDRKKDRAVEFHGIVEDSPKEYHESRILPKGRYAGKHFTPYGIEIHSKEKRYDFQEKPIERCSIMGGPCYADGTSLGASRFVHEVCWDGTDEWAYSELMVWLTRD